MTYAADWSGDTGELDRVSAANGSSVNMLGKASVSVFLCLRDRSKDVDVWKKARLSTLVGETRHNILSTTTLCKSGWIFKQDCMHMRSRFLLVVLGFGCIHIQDWILVMMNGLCQGSIHLKEVL